MNCTLVKWVCTMLINTELPNSYWWDALQYTALLHNMSPTRSLSNCTPEESWSGNKPDVSHLRVFGCKAFVHIPDKMHSKLSAKSLVCMFIRYAWQHKAYHLMHCPSGRFLKSRDVIFNKGGPTRHMNASFSTLTTRPCRLSPLLPHLLPLLSPLPLCVTFLSLRRVQFSFSTCLLSLSHHVTNHPSISIT